VIFWKWDVGFDVDCCLAVHGWHATEMMMPLGTVEHPDVITNDLFDAPAPSG
jgi:hypothetical protein